MFIKLSLLSTSRRKKNITTTAKTLFDEAVISSRSIYTLTWNKTQNYKYPVTFLSLQVNMLIVQNIQELRRNELNRRWAITVIMSG